MAAFCLSAFATLVVVVVHTSALNAQTRLDLRVIKTAESTNYEVFEVHDAGECIHETFGMTDKFPDPITYCSFIDDTEVQEFLSKQPVETFGSHLLGVTAALLADNGRIFVVNCEWQKHWWGGRRPCRKPMGTVVQASFSGWRVKLDWTEGRKRSSETFEIKHVLIRPMRGNTP